MSDALKIQCCLQNEIQKFLVNFLFEITIIPAALVPLVPWLRMNGDVTSLHLSL
jgi:hypothetical protein